MEWAILLCLETVLKLFGGRVWNYANVTWNTPEFENWLLNMILQASLHGSFRMGTVYWGIEILALSLKPKKRTLIKWKVWNIYHCFELTCFVLKFLSEWEHHAAYFVSRFSAFVQILSKGILINKFVAWELINVNCMIKALAFITYHEGNIKKGLFQTSHFTGQGHPMTVFRKICVRRSRWCLKFYALGRLKIFKWQFHSCTINFGSLSNKFSTICLISLIFHISLPRLGFFS